MKNQPHPTRAVQIEDIEKLEAEPGTRRFDAKNIFLFSFYLQGMRVKDCLELTWKQIKGDHLFYKASKTKKARPRKLINRAKAILEYYKLPKQKPDDKVFPFLRDVDIKEYGPRKYVKLIDSKNSLIRKELMKVLKNWALKNFRCTWHVIPLPTSPGK